MEVTDSEIRFRLTEKGLRELGEEAPAIVEALEAIPLFGTVGDLGQWLGIPGLRWFDDRLCCKHVHQGQRPPDGCYNLVVDGQTKYGPCNYPNGTCMLYPPRPCAFDDTDFNWERAEEIKRQNEEALGQA